MLYKQNLDCVLGVGRYFPPSLMGRDSEAEQGEAISVSVQRWSPAFVGFS